jgi:hypothetical protein
MFAQAIADFQANPWLYISIPFISGIIGYVTKVVAIQMMFAPMDFWGFKILVFQLVGKALCRAKPKKWRLFRLS